MNKQRNLENNLQFYQNKVIITVLKCTVIETGL